MIRMTKTRKNAHLAVPQKHQMRCMRNKDIVKVTKSLGIVSVQIILMFHHIERMQARKKGKRGIMRENRRTLIK